MRSKVNNKTEITINSKTCQKQVHSENSSSSISVAHFKSKNHNYSSKVELDHNIQSNHVLKMNEDTEGEWEVAGGGRKKSKSKAKQSISNTTNLYQNGINVNNSKIQVKTCNGGQKGSQRKVSAPTPISTTNNKRSTFDKKDKNRNISVKSINAATINSNASNDYEKYSGVSTTNSNERNDSPITHDISERPSKINSSEKTLTIFSTNSYTNSIHQSEEAKITQQDSMGNIAYASKNTPFKSFNDKSVINESLQDDNSKDDSNEKTQTIYRSEDQIPLQKSWEDENRNGTIMMSKEIDIQEPENKSNNHTKETFLVDENLNLTKENNMTALFPDSDEASTKAQFLGDTESTDENLSVSNGKCTSYCHEGINTQGIEAVCKFLL